MPARNRPPAACSRPLGLPGSWTERGVRQGHIVRLTISPRKVRSKWAKTRASVLHARPTCRPSTPPRSFLLAGPSPIHRCRSHWCGLDPPTRPFGARQGNDGVSDSKPRRRASLGPILPTRVAIWAMACRHPLGRTRREAVHRQSDPPVRLCRIRLPGARWATARGSSGRRHAGLPPRPWNRGNR